MMMTIKERLTKTKTDSASLAAQLAQQRDEVAARQAEITALRTRAGEAETEMQRLVVARELDGQDVDSALARVRDARRAALERASDLDERTATGLVIIRRSSMRTPPRGRSSPRSMTATPRGSGRYCLRPQQCRKRLSAPATTRANWLVRSACRAPADCPHRA